MKPIEDFIDQRNQDIWDTVCQHYSVTLVETDKPYWAIYTILNTATIFAPRLSASVDSFTHELLHIYLKALKMLAGNRIMLIVRGKPVLSSFLSTPLLEHIGNCMDHVKMLPIYLEHGFDVTRFVEDYDLCKCTKSDLLDFYTVRNTRVYRDQAIDFFIGKFFAIKACPNTTFDYTESLQVLRNAEPELFSILETFWNQWLAFDIHRMDPIFNDYGKICHNFIDALEVWAQQR